MESRTNLGVADYENSSCLLETEHKAFPIYDLKDIIIPSRLTGTILVEFLRQMDAYAFDLSPPCTNFVVCFGGFVEPWR